MAKKRGYRTVTLTLVKKKRKQLKLFTSEQVPNAAHEVLDKLETLFYGVRLGMVLQSVYERGLTEGRGQVFQQFDALKGSLPHRLPGRPRRRAR